MVTNKKALPLIAVVLAIIIGNLVIFNQQSSELAPTKIESSYLGPNGEIIQVDSSEFASSQSSIVMIATISIAVVLLLVSLFVYSVADDKKKKRFDEQRIKDLKTIADGLELYFQSNSHYPISQSYAAEYYTGVNLAADWQYYNFPSTEEMQKYITGWPVHDPAANLNKKNQQNNYIYYPKNQGKSFDLYAHLDHPTQDQKIDYNTQDNLPQAWGSYNYKVSSQANNDSLPVVAAQSQIHEPTITTPEPSLAPADTTNESYPVPVVNDQVIPVPSIIADLTEASDSEAES